MSQDPGRPLRAGILALALCAGPALAVDPGLLPPAVGVAEFYAQDPASGAALRGFDPVAYQLGAPGPGREDVEALWDGASWRFRSAANRAAFLSAPEVYAPRLGGFDAEAAARGVLAEGDPERFAILEGRLYLFRDEASRLRFLSQPGLAGAAEAGWAALERRVVRPNRAGLTRPGRG